MSHTYRLRYISTTFSRTPSHARYLFAFAEDARLASGIIARPLDGPLIFALADDLCATVMPPLTAAPAAITSAYRHFFIGPQPTCMGLCRRATDIQKHFRAGWLYRQMVVGKAMSLSIHRPMPADISFTPDAMAYASIATISRVIDAADKMHRILRRAFCYHLLAWRYAASYYWMIYMHYFPRL